MHRIVSAAAALLLLLGTAGCESLRYYGQAASGHLRLMRNSVPISTLLANPDVSEDYRNKLQIARDARRFASEALQLPDNASYTRFVPIPGKAVTYNVVAAPEFSLEPVRWCFPVAGCINYRGYFQQEDAQVKADALRHSGHDVVTTYAAAYSTLGWFDDPIPETILRGSEERMVSLIFHELAHQKLYRDNDTAFNESYASAVAIAGLHRWLLAHGRDPSRNVAAQRIAERQQVLALLQPTREELKQLYASDLSPDEMRTQKARLLSEARQRHAQHAPELPRWSQWFARLNNAALISLADYSDGVPGFLRLLEDCGENWACFHRQAAAIAEDQSQRDALMEQP